MILRLQPPGGDPWILGGFRENRDFEEFILNFSWDGSFLREFLSFWPSIVKFYDLILLFHNFSIFGGGEGGYSANRILYEDPLAVAARLARPRKSGSASSARNPAPTPIFGRAKRALTAECWYTLCVPRPMVPCRDLLARPKMWVGTGFRTCGPRFYGPRSTRA